MVSVLPHAFFLCGPTASGKSSVALQLCRHIGAEIVNADAFQLYRDLDICTAKPGREDQRACAHHLYSVLEPSEACDAQRYRELAEPVIQGILARGRWPVVVGGSGLYVKSLTHGLATLPKMDAALRAQIHRMTLEEQVAELLRLDPAAAENVSLQNERYVSRALEICLLTGRPQSEVRRSWQHNAPDFMGVVITRERADLYERINRRVVQMVQDGAIDEVRELLQAHPAPHLLSPNDTQPSSLPLARAIGVREIAACLRGELSLEETIAAIQQATRRYAKRQGTWFKRESGFQTVCLAPDSTAQSAVERLLALFPCLHQPPQPLSAPSSSI